MNDTPLTSERIIETAEDVLRRFGPEKTTVVDVARALGVTHGSVYRHFPSKAALRDAVAQRWLARIADPLDDLAKSTAPPTERLRRWLDALIAAKHQLARDDPSLFAAYVALSAASRGVIQEHVEHLLQQLRRIIEDGMAQGEYTVPDSAVAARAVFDATTRFHNPAHVMHWSDPTIDADFIGVWELLLIGLRNYEHTA